MRARRGGARGPRAAGAALVALGLLASGCGGDGGASANGEVTIRYSWWGAQDRAVMMKKAIALFEKKYPRINVATDFQEYGDFWTKFNTQAAGGNPPDVFQNSIGFLRKYDDRNLLLDLNEQVEAGNLSTDGFRNGLETIGEVDDKLLGLPVGINTFALVYNVEAFERVGITPEFGWTWDDFDAAVQKVGAGKEDFWGASDNGGVLYLYDLHLRQQGKAMLTEDGELGFTEADLKKWWGDHHADNEAGLLVPAKKADQVKPQSTISSDLSAAEFTWDNFMGRYMSETDTELALGPIPTTDGKRTGQYFSAQFLSASARTKHPEEVATFIDFMTHDAEVGRVMRYDRGVPASQAQFEAYQPEGADALIAAYEEQVTERGLLEDITPHPNGFDVVEAAFLKIYEGIASGTTSVDDGVSQFFDEAKSALGN